jgi:hypothetical protein
MSQFAAASLVREDLLSTPALLSSQIPGDDAEWDEIADFARTFNAYEHCGSFARCADIANARQADTLEDLRTCLFFEQRRWRHFGEDPDEDAMSYIRGLITQMRAKVSGP